MKHAEFREAARPPCQICQERTCCYEINLKIHDGLIATKRMVPFCSIGNSDKKQLSKKIIAAFKALLPAAVTKTIPQPPRAHTAVFAHLVCRLFYAFVALGLQGWLGKLLLQMVFLSCVDLRIPSKQPNQGPNHLVIPDVL